MRRLVIAAVTAAVLACAPSAAAKEITSVTACGTDGCTTTHDKTLIAALMDGSAPTDPPLRPAGAIRLRAKIEEPGGTTIGRTTNWWVPGTSLIAAEDGSWLDLGPRSAAVLERIAGGFTPFAPGRIGAAFARTATTPPPAPAPASTDGGGANVDWLLIVVPVGVALAAAAALVLVRRRPGGATP